MNNEPVAWINKIRTRSYLEWDKDDEADESIPLYQQQINISDEEIDKIVRDFFGEVGSFYDFRLVIRRCIRKAQE